MSKTLTLKAEIRRRTGSGVLKQMRREGFIPTVVYGVGAETRNLKVNTKTFTELLAHSASSNIVVDLDIEGTKQLAFIQAVQTNPLSGHVIHADFLAVNAKTEITAHIPVSLLGDAPGVKNGGVLDQQIHDLEIICLPGDLPERIEADVSEMKIGDLLHVGDLKFPKGVSTHLGEEIIVAALQAPRTEEEEVETEEKAADEVEATEQKGDSEESEDEEEKKD